MAIDEALTKKAKQAAWEQISRNPKNGCRPPMTKPTTAPDIAVILGDQKMVEYLILQGAKVSGRHMPDGKNLLHICNDSSVMAVVIEQGTIVDQLDEEGTRALHYVACYGSPRMAGLLIQAGAYVLAHDNAQSTPLREAIKAVIPLEASETCHDEQLEGHHNLRKKIKTLSDAGVDVKAHDNRGLIPFQ